MTRAGELLWFHEEKNNKGNQPKDPSKNRGFSRDINPFSNKKPTNKKKKFFSIPGRNNDIAQIGLGCPNCKIMPKKLPDDLKCPTCKVQLETMGGVIGANSLGGLPTYGSGMSKG